MANKRIYLDAGHGGSDPGAVKYVKEAEVNIKVVNYMYSYLKANYVCTLKKDVSADSLNTICNRANNWKADLFVSIHFNAGGGDGFEALVYSVANEYLGEVFEKYAKSVGQNSRGVKYRPDLAVLRLTKMEAVLCEIAFVDNKKDIQDWNDDAELRKMGEAMAKAAAEYLGLPLKKAGLVDCNDFKVKVVSTTLKVRQKPSTTGKLLTRIKKGEVYTIVKKTADDKWGLLKAGPIKGSSYISLNEKYVEVLK